MLENRRRIDRLEQGEELSREELALLLSTTMKKTGLMLQKRPDP